MCRRYFAHGFLTLDARQRGALQDQSGFYTPMTERGVRYDDPAVGIEWPMQVASVSDKDLSLARRRRRIVRARGPGGRIMEAATSAR
jgi:dTDP-4-dehydrorhamnose 3,5-epimerase-like enzyme